MGLVGLFRYISALFGLLFVFLFGFVTYHPDAGIFETAIQAIAGGGAIAFAAAAIVLERLSQDYWVHRSLTLWALALAVAVTATLFLISVI